MKILARIASFFGTISNFRKKPVEKELSFFEMSSEQQSKALVDAVQKAQNDPDIIRKIYENKIAILKHLIEREKDQQKTMERTEHKRYYSGSVHI